MSSAAVVQNTLPDVAAALSIPSIDQNNVDSYLNLSSEVTPGTKSRQQPQSQQNSSSSTAASTRSPTNNANATDGIIHSSNNQKNNPSSVKNQTSTGNNNHHQHHPPHHHHNHSSQSSENHNSTNASHSSPTVGPGGGVTVPPRTSSQYRTSTRESSPLQFESQNMESATTASTTSPSVTASTSAARRRTQQTSEHLNPAVTTENSGNDNYTIHISDPTEDVGRLEARMQEARGHAPNVSTPQAAAAAAPDHEEVTRSGGGGSSSKREGGSKRRQHKLGSYILGQTLGEGEFGKVKLGWRKDDGMQVAIKIIRKDSLSSNAGREQKIAREIKILQTLNHPNIVRLHDIVNDERHIGLALEYASGGELFDYILHNRYLKDHSARKLFAQLISGVGYLHKKGIVHRDLKLENLLLDRNRNIIITDFGFANEFNPYDDLSQEIIDNIKNKDFVTLRGLDKLDAHGRRRGDLMQTSCGSPCYAAPELVVTDSLYTGRKVDVWSCGVILYAMLAGYLPFDDDPANPEGDNINLLYRYIVNTPLIFPEYVTPHARDLLKQILVPDPRHRADLFTVARHSWLAEYADVVGLITSSATTDKDIANTTVNSTESRSALARSASVREPTTKSHPRSMAAGGSHPQKVHAEDETKTTPRDTKRRTVQLEYVAPQANTTRSERYQRGQNTINEVQDDTVGTYVPTSATTPPSEKLSGQQVSSLPTRPIAGRDQRATSENVLATVPLGASSGQRPATGGSTAAARVPGSRGNSYGQPAANIITKESTQGRISQPRLSTYTPDEFTPGNRHSYMGPSSSNDEYKPGQGMGYPSTISKTAQVPGQGGKPTGHRRSTTLSGITERLGFGKKGSIFSREKDKDREGLESAAGIEEGVPSTPGGPRSRVGTSSGVTSGGKKYPPVSMRSPIPNDNAVALGTAAAVGAAAAAGAAGIESQPRRSTDSRRTSFTFGRKKQAQPATAEDSSPTSATPSQSGSAAGVPPPVQTSTKEKRGSRRFSNLLSFGRKDKDKEKYIGAAATAGPKTPVSPVDKNKELPRLPPKDSGDHRSKMAFGRGESRSDSRSSDGNSSDIPVLYDSMIDGPGSKAGTGYGKSTNLSRKPLPPTSHPRDVNVGNNSKYPDKYPDYPVKAGMSPYMPPPASDDDGEAEDSEDNAIVPSSSAANTRQAAGLSPAKPPKDNVNDDDDESGPEMQHNILPTSPRSATSAGPSTTAVGPTSPRGANFSAGPRTATGTNSGVPPSASSTSNGHSTGGLLGNITTVTAGDQPRQSGAGQKTHNTLVKQRRKLNDDVASGGLGGEGGSGSGSGSSGPARKVMEFFSRRRGRSGTVGGK